MVLRLYSLSLFYGLLTWFHYSANIDRCYQGKLKLPCVYSQYAMRTYLKLLDSQCSRSEKSHLCGTGFMTVPSCRI